MKSLSVLVVGAASGIGLETLLLLKQQGHDVTAADIEHAQVEAPFILLDIKNKAGYKNALQKFSDEGKRFDALVITAAVHNAHPVEYLSDALVDDVMAVNLCGHIKFVRDMLPHIHDGGRIVAVSSIAAGIGIPMESLYSASKAGLEMFYESLQAEIAYRKIKCVLIQPGNVNTGFNEKGNDYKESRRPEIDLPYKKVIERIDSRCGMSPRVVAQSIGHALTVARPSFCYVVGLNALKAHWAKRILGRDSALSLMNKFFGI